jgi:hypothetical protein
MSIRDLSSHNNVFTELGAKTGKGAVCGFQVAARILGEEEELILIELCATGGKRQLDNPTLEL